MPSDSELNRLLDEALQSYAAEPDSLLEHRILASVRSEANINGKAAGTRWMEWGLAAIACAVVVGIVVFISHSRRQQVEPAHSPVAATLRRPGDLQPSVVTSPVGIRPSRRASAHQAPKTVAIAAKSPAESPKLDVFPLPEPPTAQERALAAFSKNPPWKQQPPLVHAEELEVEPIRIAEIHVEPLPPVIEGEHQ